MPAAALSREVVGASGGRHRGASVTPRQLEFVLWNHMPFYTERPFRRPAGVLGKLWV